MDHLLILQFDEIIFLIPNFDQKQATDRLILEINQS